MSYVLPYIEEFSRHKRVYLHDHDDLSSFVSFKLLNAVSPDLEIQESDRGAFVVLHLIWGEYEFPFDFDVIHSDKYELVLGGNHLADYDMSSEDLVLPGIVVPIYQR